MSKKKIIFYLCLVIFVIFVVFFSYAWGKGIWPFGERKYQAVQLSNGDIYYGHLCLFPSPKLTDVYFIQNVPAAKEGEQPTTKLAPLTSLFFAPENVMHLNKDQILWWADLRGDSQVLQLIKQQKEKK